jgi:molybdopterin-guanine dinucleotide biosynthesis protein A
MGRDKASLEVGGMTLAERAVHALSAIANSVAVVGFPVDGFRCVSDADRKAAPRAAVYGLEASLADSRSEWTAILACDLPFVTADLFRSMLATAESDSADAVVPLQPDGRLQPLAAVYRTAPCRRAIDAAIAHGELRLAWLVRTIRHRALQPAEYSELSGSDLFFLNVNTLDDLAAARRIAAG